MKKNTPWRNISIGSQHQTEAQAKGQTPLSDTQPTRQGGGRGRVLEGPAAICGLGATTSAGPPLIHEARAGSLLIKSSLLSH